MKIRYILFFLGITALIAGCAHAEGEGIKAEVKDWPKQSSLAESIAIKFGGAAFSAPRKDLSKQSTSSHELTLYYDHPIFQSVGFAWIENGAFMKVEDGEDSMDRYPYAKTPQEYFEKLFFLKDAPGAPIDAAFLEHKKGISEGAHKTYVKYTHGKYQIYRIEFIVAEEYSLLREMAFIFGPALKDGFIQLGWLNNAPYGQPANKNPQLFEQILFSLSDEQTWFE